MEPKIKFAEHSIQTELKILHYEEDGFYLIRMYRQDDGSVISTDAYFLPDETREDMEIEARDYRDRINNYSTPYHVKGEIVYVKRN